MQRRFIFRHLLNIIYIVLSIVRVNLHAPSLLVEEALRAEETTSKLNLPTELSALEKNTIITADDSALVYEVSAMPPSEMTVPDMIAEEGITKEFVLSAI